LEKRDSTESQVPSPESVQKTNILANTRNAIGAIAVAGTLAF